ncbi:MAG: hypothetical protein R3D29_09235 [Nitratireductor sp.]
MRARHEEALKSLTNDHEYGNGTAIFTATAMRRAAFARVRSAWSASMYRSRCRYLLHLWRRKNSSFGDLGQHEGANAFRFYTKETKTITSRWPSGVKEARSSPFSTMN